MISVWYKLELNEIPVGDTILGYTMVYGNDSGAVQGVSGGLRIQSPILSF